MEFKRIAYYKVKEIMDSFHIPILIGLRRTGKTTILKQLRLEYGDDAIIISADSFPLASMTDIEFYSYLESIISAGKSVLLIDEIQIRDKWDLITKNLFDKYVANKKLKVVITGSSSLTFEGRDTGVDRTQKVLITTLDFNEYLNISGKQNTYDEFENFLGRGAFPEYINKNLTFEDLSALAFEPIINEDIPYNFKISQRQLARLLMYLSSLSSGEFNKNKASNTTEISATQIDKYIEVLEKTQIIKTVNLIFENGNYPIYNKFKIYINPHFHLWILNKDFKNLDDKFKGHIIESYWLFAATQINGYYKKFYYLKHKETNEEIDFVSLNGDGTFKTLHEFKYTDHATSKFYKMLSLVKSKNKVVWCKENSSKALIKFESIKDYKNESIT